MDEISQVMDMEITVSRTDLLQAIKTLSLAAKSKSPPDLVISCNPDQLVLRLGGSQCTISGKGYFPSQAHVNGRYIKGFSASLPVSEDIQIEQKPDGIKFGDLEYGCLWENQPSRTIHLPINASFMDVLSLGQRFSVAEIETSGYLSQFKALEAEKQKRISQAYKYLSKMDVTKEELTCLVDQAIDRYNRQKFPE